MRKRRLLAFAIFAFFMVICCQRAHAASASDVESSVFVLLDLSTSYYSASTKDRIRRVLHKANQVIIELVDRLPQPIAFGMLPIGEFGLSDDPICDGVYTPRLLGKSKPGELSKPKELADFLKVCADVALKQKERKATDLSGAIIHAVRLTEGQMRGPKIVIILSDMLEARPSKGTLPAIDVKEFRFGIVYHVHQEQAIDPAKLDSLLQEWVRRLKSGGAERVILRIETERLGPELAEELAR